MEDLRYQHPSYGNIQINRTTGNRPCFMAEDLDYGGYITIKIDTATANRRLSETTSYSNNRILQIRMTYNQYAELLGSFNTSGVPCTIEYITPNGNGIVDKYEPLPSEIDMFDLEIDKETQSIYNKLSELQTLVNNINNKRNVIKKDVKSIKETIDSLSISIKDKLPFIQQMYKEYINKYITKAKVQVGSWIEYKLYSLGLDNLINTKQIEQSKDNEEH